MLKKWLDENVNGRQVLCLWQVGKGFFYGLGRVSLIGNELEFSFHKPKRWYLTRWIDYITNIGVTKSIENSESTDLRFADAYYYLRVDFKDGTILRIFVLKTGLEERIEKTPPLRIE